jgi:transposase
MKDITYGTSSRTRNNSSPVYKWRKEYEEFGQGSFPGNGKLKQTEQERIAELERKLKDAELERYIKSNWHLSKNGR